MWVLRTQTPVLLIAYQIPPPVPSQSIFYMLRKNWSPLSSLLSNGDLAHAFLLRVLWFLAWMCVINLELFFFTWHEAKDSNVFILMWSSSHLQVNCWRNCYFPLNVHVPLIKNPLAIVIRVSSRLSVYFTGLYVSLLLNLRTDFFFVILLGIVLTTKTT